MTRKSHGEAVARVVIERSRIDIVPLAGLTDGQLLYANSVRGPSADGAPSLQRTLSEPLAASAPAVLECELRQWFNSFAGDHGKTEWESLLAIVARPAPAVEVRDIAGGLTDEK